MATERYYNRGDEGLEGEKMLNVGVIGYGSRMRFMVRTLLEVDDRCRIAAIADVRKEQLQQKAENDGLKGVQWFDNADEMLASTQLDGVMIGTRCSLHTEMAMKVLAKGIPLLLEKPVSTTMDDLQKLKDAASRTTSKTVVSFPLRVTSIVRCVREIIDSGKIGTVEHVQAINNVPYGGVYFQNWYRDENETGGLFLQKATHDFDYIQYLVQEQPIEICAMTSKQIFKGNKPAGLKCVDCEDNRVCLESTVHGMHKRTVWQYCCYAEDTGNEDSGSALIRYQTGMHVSYSQNFFVRRKAGMRGARLLGYKGTIQFDFNTGVVQVFMHHTPRVERYEFEPSEGHFGGDHVLVDSFSKLMRGGEESVATLEDGMLSALMCMKARQSAATRTFQAISWD